MRRLIPVVLAAALAAGCTLDPAYRRPVAPVPAAFPQGPSYAPPASGPAAASLAWRSVFTDPDLQAVIELALAQNRDLRVAVANIESARGQYAVQRSALFPAIDATVSSTYQRSPGTRGLAGFDQRFYSATIGATAWELDLFGRTRSLSRAAFEQYLATQDARRAVQVSLISQVATAWFTVAADRELLAVAEETFTAQQATLDLTRSRADAGVASMLDVRQVETTVEQARSDVAAFTTALAQSRNALDLLVGAPVPEARLPKGLPVTGGVAEVQAGLTSEALLARPDVQEAEHQLRSANANIGAARAAFFPTVSLTAQAGQQVSAIEKLFDAGSRSWLFQPSITQPLFAGGANVGGLRAAKGQRDAAVAQYEKAIQTAFREVADALARQGTIGQQLSAEQALVAAAADSLTLSTARYERGTDDYLAVLVAQRTFYTAQESLISTRLTRVSNLATLYAALGGGLV